VLRFSLSSNKVWDDIAMDFMLGLPSSRGYIVIFEGMDHLSKHQFASLYVSFFAMQVVEVFITIMVKLHEFLHSTDFL